MTQDVPVRKSAFAAALRRALIKLAIGLVVIWGTIYIVDQKTRESASPSQPAAEVVG